MSFRLRGAPRFVRSASVVIAEEKTLLFRESAYRAFFISDFSSKTEIILKKDMVSDKKYIGFSAHRVYNIRGIK